MQNMTAIEVKAFVPSKDFSLSKRFYQHLASTSVGRLTNLHIFTTAIQASSCRSST